MEIIVIGKSQPLTYAGSHYHDTWELILNIEGEGTMEVGDKSFDFNEGDVVLIPPRVPHIKRASNKFIDIFAQIGGLSYSLGFVKFHDSDCSVSHILNTVHAVNHRNAKGCKGIIDSLGDALEQIIIERTERPPLDSHTEIMVQTIVERFGDPDFSMTEAIAKSGYCDDHARRIFTREMGKTPLEYLTDIRIDHAKKLLSENSRLNYSIAEIALSSGYSDISYFSRVFKKHTGMSPKAYVERCAATEATPPPAPICNGCGEAY